MTLGITPEHLNLMIDFLVIKVPLVYNMILGHLYMKIVRVVLSTYHLVMKFSIEVGIRDVKRNQVMAKECYFTTIKGKQKVKKTIPMNLNFIK